MQRMVTFITYSKQFIDIGKELSARTLHLSASLPFQTSTALCGEPLKKKKKLDPAIIKIQTERRKKRIEKQIKRLERYARKLKPIDEFELHREIKKDQNSRLRQNDIKMLDVKDHQAQVVREWAKYSKNKHMQIHNKMADMIAAQEKALSELKIASPELYNQAVKVDEGVLPFSFTGPCETPPIPGYVRDGVYKETTKSYEIDPEVVKAMLDKNSDKKKKATN